MKKKTNITKFIAALLLGVTVFSACADKSGENEEITQASQTEETEDDSEESAWQLWKKLSTKEYPKELIDLVKRNPETYDFVCSFKEEADKEHDIDLSELENTDSIPYFCQWDVRWGFEQYNNKYFALTGCGPTCLSMVAIYLTGNSEYSPLWMGNFLDSHGYAVPGTGTAWSVFDDGIVEIGLYGTAIENSFDSICEALDGGMPVIASMSKGDFTTKGHFVVFVSHDVNSIMVYDPNSKERTRSWDFSDLEPQIASAWAMYVDGDPQDEEWGLHEYYEDEGSYETVFDDEYFEDYLEDYSDDYSDEY